MIIVSIVLFLAIIVTAEVTTWNWTPLYRFLGWKSMLPKDENVSGIISIPLKREPRSPSESFKNPPKFSL